MNRASLLAAFAVAGAALSACSGAPGDPSAPAESVGSAASEVTVPVTASESIARAEEWVAAQLPYCQSANHQPDSDPSCSPTCTRPDNPAWDAYRSDCSGLLSWAWGLPAPGRVTWEFAPGQTDISHTIDATTLAMGDAVNKPHDHTMLFKAWITPGVRATFIEEPGCSANPPYAHEFDSNVTISGTSITVAYNGITFDAIRYDALLADDGGAGGGDSGPGSDAGAATKDSGAVASDAASPTPGEDAGADAAEPPGTSEAGDGEGGATATQVQSMSSGCSASRGPVDANAAVALVGVALLAARRRRRA